MSKQSKGDTVALTASAHVLVRGGIEESTAEVMTAAVVAERAGWCAALTREMAARILEEHWNPADVRALASGRDAAGQPLPKQAYMALRRLGWPASAPDGMYVNDRVTRMAQEQAGRLLRAASWRDTLVSGILGTWPEEPTKRTNAEWDAVRAAVPGGKYLPSGVIRSRTRQIRAFENKHGQLPADVFELEAPPNSSAMLLLSVCDRQEATIERSTIDPRRALLRAKLPTRPNPRTRQDWSWVSVPLVLPPTVPTDAALHLPTLRIVKGMLRAEVPFTRPVPATHRAGHETALGVDWGISTLLSAGPACLDPEGTISALGAGAQHRADGVLAKLDRLRRQNEHLHAKIDRYERLSGGNPAHPLAGKTGVLREEAARVAARRAHLNDALACSAARWTVDQAIAADATVIYLENLADLEARGMGKNLNTRLSQSVRGKIADWTRHLAAKEGIAVVTVPPQSTSKHCPRCLAVLRHRKAPDRPAEPGWKWASCPGCGWQGDRDQGAWMRIAARGLAHQAETAVDRKTGTMTVRSVNDALEARAVITPYMSGTDRSKTGPTPRQRKSPPAPRRRGTPSPARPSGPAGQRPEGHAITARTSLPRAAARDQGASTASEIPARRPHRARGAALGAGFHRNAHATPPRWEHHLQSPPDGVTEDKVASQRRFSRYLAMISSMPGSASCPGSMITHSSPAAGATT